MGSVLEPGDCVHKGTRDVEWRHADVDIEHDLSEGGASGGIESLESNKHLTEIILTVLFLREKVTILPSSNCHIGCALLDDEVKGRDEGLGVPSLLGQVGVAVSVQNKVDTVLQKEGKTAYFISSCGSRVCFKVISTL